MFAPTRTRPIVIEDSHPEWCVLLDGIGPNWFQMKWMGRPLAEYGFSVVSLEYPSAQSSIRELAANHVGPALREIIPSSAEKVHFVALSMGGILTRALLQTQFRPQNLGRVVMLASPNQGSEVADWLHRLPLFQWLFGPAGSELTTRPDSTPNQLGPANFECGILAGDRSLDPWFSWMFSGPNDGKVAVSRARLEGMKAFRVVAASHYDIMRNPLATRLTATFLRTGNFELVEAIST